MPSVGVIIGRFQVPALTAGHRALIDHVDANYDYTVILVGVAHHLSKHNPLPYPQVEDVITDYVESAFIPCLVLPLLDGPSNEEWSARIDSLLATIYPGMEKTLICGRDGFKPCYKGKLPVKEVPTQSPSLTGTETRQKVLSALHGGEDYRKGLIAAQLSGFDRVFPVIDVAILSDHILGQGLSVLMGRKGTEELNRGYRFIGGFVDPGDISLENTVRREAMEETGLEVGNICYVSSHTIKDWRYRGTNDTVMSSLFVADRLFGISSPKDDIQSLEWVPLRDVAARALPLHLPLAESLLSYTYKRGLLK